MNTLKRCLIMLLTIPICVVLQMLVLPLIPHLIAVPNLILIEVMTFGFLFGKTLGLVAGVVSGLVLDLIGSGTPGFYTMILSLLGYADGFLSEKMESDLIPILYGILLGNEILFHLYVFVLAFLIRKHFSFKSYLTGVFLPELFLTMIAFLLVYGVLIFLARRFDLKVNKGEVKIV